AVYDPWQASPSLVGEQSNSRLLVRMERRGPPLRRLLEACSYIFRSALEMAAGPPDGSSAPASPTSPFKGGVVEEEGGEDAGGVKRPAAATATAGSQQGWEAFNRSMDDRDEEVLQAVAVAAAAAAGGEKVKERELPAPMLEVLKVALSLLRRLSNRNLTAAGPFASTMQMWPSGHPQEEKGETDPERNDGGDDGDDNDDDDDGSPPAAGGAAAAGAAAAADTTAGRGGGAMSPPQPQAPGAPTPMAVATPMAVEPPSTPDAPSRGAGARGGSGAAAAADSTPVAGRNQSSQVRQGLGIAKAIRRLLSQQDGGKAKANTPPPRFSSDLFIRRVHLLVGEVLEPLWRDPRLASLPPEAASRVLATVLELLQSLQ
ncbi:unnamed protein product, partial [Ectocarpus fasciculatus]